MRALDPDTVQVHECRQRLSSLGKRLPRCGYESLVEEGPGYRIWLVNEAGRFRVRVWWVVTFPLIRRAVCV